MFFCECFSGKKEELVLRLIQSDEMSQATGQDKKRVVSSDQADNLSTDDLRELATIADEMRHIRRQWVRFY